MVFLCDSCGKSFPYKSYLHRHIENAHEKETCVKCERQISKHKLLTHVCVQKTICKYCETVCEYGLSLHIQNFHTDGKFQCLSCNKKFANKRSLKRHKCKVDIKQEILECIEDGIPNYVPMEAVSHDHIPGFPCTAPEINVCETAGTSLGTFGISMKKEIIKRDNATVQPCYVKLIRIDESINFKNRIAESDMEEEQNTIKTTCLLKTTRIVNLDRKNKSYHSVTDDERLTYLKLRLSGQNNIQLNIASQGNIAPGGVVTALNAYTVPEYDKDRISYFGEEGTYERLLEQGTYNYLLPPTMCNKQRFAKTSIHRTTKAYKDFFKYMHWNSEHRCALCKTQYTLFSDFLRHCLVGSSCSKQIKIGNSFHCPPCKEKFEFPNQFIMHMIREDYHGTGTVCNIPKIDSNSYRKLFEQFRENEMCVETTRKPESGSSATNGRGTEIHDSEGEGLDSGSDDSLDEDTNSYREKTWSESEKDNSISFGKKHVKMELSDSNRNCHTGDAQIGITGIGTLENESGENKSGQSETPSIANGGTASLSESHMSSETKGAIDGSDNNRLPTELNRGAISDTRNVIDSQLDKEPLRLKYRKVFLKKFLECGNFKVGFECTMCKSVNLRGHVYRTVVQALRHVELVHTMERVKKKSGGVYKKTLCSYCGEYVLNVKYGSHIESCHPDAVQHHQKKWKTCLFCSKVFDCTFNRTEYNGHLSQHRNNPFKKDKSRNIPRQCDICGKIYTNFRTHRKIHFRSKESKYFCPDCPKSFSLEINFLHHKKLHKMGRNFRCDQCGKSFKMKHHLSNHMLSHSDEMPFKCNYCGRRFRMKHQIKAHVMRLHEK